MKKGKTIYLWFIIIFFIILWVPYFQNVGTTTGDVLFFMGTFTFVGIYPWLLIFGVVEGALIVLYVQSLVEDIKKQDVKKFDL